METAEAIQRLQSGDKGEPWAVLYERFFPLAQRAAVSVIRDQVEAEDIAAAVLSQLPKRIKSYRPEAGGINGWIWRVSANEAKNKLRTHSRHPAVRFDPETVTEISDIKQMAMFNRELLGHVEDSRHTEIRKTQLYDAIDNLAPADKAVIDSLLTGRTSRERKTVHGVSRKNLARAVKHLKHEVLK